MHFFASRDAPHLLPDLAGRRVSPLQLTIHVALL